LPAQPTATAAAAAASQSAGVTRGSFSPGVSATGAPGTRFMCVCVIVYIVRVSVDRVCARVRRGAGDGVKRE